jgi:UDP-N-acetylmuramyl pentapeptide synthase
MATAVAADPAAFNRKGDAASTVLELEEEAARFDVLTAAFRMAPTLRVERKHDLANIMKASCLSWRDQFAEKRATQLSGDIRG